MFLSPSSSSSSASASTIFVSESAIFNLSLYLFLASSSPLLLLLLIIVTCVFVFSFFLCKSVLQKSAISSVHSFRSNVWKCKLFIICQDKNNFCSIYSHKQSTLALCIHIRICHLHSMRSGINSMLRCADFVVHIYRSLSRRILAISQNVCVSVCECCRQISTITFSPRQRKTIIICGITAVWQMELTNY